ncbi:hypothetical protein IAT40_004793 [Kwoniella sp. CBS 6097]
MSSRPAETGSTDDDRRSSPNKRARGDSETPNNPRSTPSVHRSESTFEAGSQPNEQVLPAGETSPSWAHLTNTVYQFQAPALAAALPPPLQQIANRPSPSQVIHASSPLSQQLNEVTTPRSMATGHGSNYLAAISDLVTRVCGERVPRPEANEMLLRTYFAWQGPQHMPVDEALFRRDMTSDPPGPYFSRLLLYAIHAQASRHILARDDGWAYADKANALVIASLAEAPSIPTVQALMILSGRELALGLVSAGWLKSGMAFRMIEDLGLQSDVTKDLAMVPPHKVEDVAMRQRLFWSAYSWDKFFALTMGRQPSFHLPVSKNLRPPLSEYSSGLGKAVTVTKFVSPLVRDSSPWQPFFPDEVVPASPAQPGYSGETFYALCLLNIELEQIIQRLYDPEIRENPIDQVAIIDNLKLRLLDWRTKVASQILLDTSYLPPFCPPQHILTLNLLYRTAWILLQRPLIRYESTHHEARQACVAKSAEIHLLFELHDRTFSLRNITYIMAYMAYVSATIDVTEAVSLDPVRSSTAANRLELTLRVLTKAAHHTPGIQRSIHHLKQRLTASHTSQRGSRAVTPTTAHPSGHLDQVNTAQAILINDSMSQPFGASTHNINVFGDMPLAVGFEELFATLLPEYSTESTLPQSSSTGENTAFLPMMDDEWFRNL